MILIYLYIKGLSVSAKLIFGVLASSAFFVFLALLIWFGFFADTLSRYAPIDSDYYIHVSKTDSNQLLDGIIISIFGDYGLSFVKPQEIEHEMAVFGKIGECSGLILRVKDSDRIRKELGKNGVENSYIAGNKIIISNCQDVISRKHYSAISSKTKTTYLPNSLGIYLGNKVVSSDRIFQAVCAKAKQDGSCFIGARMESDRVKLFIGREGKSLPVTLPMKINNQEFDFSAGGGSLAKYISNFYQLSSSSDVINNLAYLPSAIGQNRINSSLILINEKTSTSDSFWNRFDVYWKIDLSSDLSREDVLKLENILMSEVAQEFPSKVNTQLTDGTSVTELIAQTSKFSFLDGEGYKYFNYPDNSANIYYKTSNNALIITNNRNWLDFQMSQEGKTDFIAVKSKILPETKLFQYIKFFKYIWADKNSIYLR